MFGGGEAVSFEMLLSKNLFSDLKKTLAAPLIESYSYPWEILSELSDFILELSKKLPNSEYDEIFSGVFAHKSAKISDNTCILGPTVICEDAQIRHGAFVRGSAIIGRGAVIGNSTEIKNSVIFDKAQIPHFNYVGDSVLGYRAHLGAGVITSNVRLDKRSVLIRCKEGNIETGLKKCGAMIGDFVEVGCNSVLNPGSVVVAHTRIAPLSSIVGCYAG
jgi:NDP-sugar pyrophosphorylase family protein